MQFELEGPSVSHCAALQIVQKAADLQEAISEGATSFLLTEYKYMGVFMVCHCACQRLHALQRGSSNCTRFYTGAANGMLQGVPILYMSIPLAVSGIALN